MISRCPECGMEQVTKMNNEIICQSCGLVLDDSMFEESPYLEEGKEKHAKIPSLISAGGMKVDGNIVKNTWLYSTKEKNLRKAEDRIDSISDSLSIPKYVTKEAFRIFKLANEEELNVGRDNLSLIYASLYASCLINGLPKTPLELTMNSEISKTKMMRSYSVLKNKLKLNTGVVNPVDFIPRFGSKLGLKAGTITFAIKMVEKLKDKPLISGKNPQTVVASALYLASKINEDYKTQREVANVTGVLEVTIRKMSKKMSEELN